jgi:hypothetical protein
MPAFKSEVIGEGARDKPKVRTGLGKSDCPGSQGGCRKRGLFKEVRAPAFYPDGAAVKAENLME